MLTKDQILNADDIITEEVQLPEWGGSVLVKCMTGNERSQIEKMAVNKSTIDKVSEIRMSVLIMTVIDETGNKLFSESDIIKLMEKSANPIQRLFDVAMRLSGLDKESQDELEKN